PIAGSRSTATRDTLGAISLRSSSHFTPMPYSYKTKPVALPPGRARLSTKSSADWIDGMCEHDRHGSSYRLQRRNSRAGRGQDDIRGECSQFGCKFTLKGGIACGPANVNPYVLTFGPAQFL